MANTSFTLAGTVFTPIPTITINIAEMRAKGSNKSAINWIKVENKSSIFYPAI
jgi:hypothetical protein